jgi:hypothetical protein
VRLVAVVTALSALAIAPSCQSPGCRTPQITVRDVDVDQPEQVVLEARMTHDGEPVPNAVIEFRLKLSGEGGGELRKATGFTDADGVARYKMGEVSTVADGLAGLMFVTTGYIAEFRDANAVNDVAYCFVTSDEADFHVENPGRED